MLQKFISTLLSMPNFFKFESDFIESLRCIPMQVRLKLDTCGVKLKLQHWHQFSQAERQFLVELPCDSVAESQFYKNYIQKLVTNYTGQPAGELIVEEQPAWLNTQTLPETVVNQAQECAVEITLEQWQHLTPVQRFALIKLSRSHHENANFLPALREFKMIE